VAAGALSEQWTALRLLMAPASTLVVDELLVALLAIRPLDADGHLVCRERARHCQGVV
jgi:hypothetical protein